MHYKFFPGVWKWKTITKSEIESFEFSAMNSIFEKLECGYSRNLFFQFHQDEYYGEKIPANEIKRWKENKNWL
jgi:hypothetical protein